VLIELFSLDVTAEALQTNIEWKSAFFEGMWSIAAKFSRSSGRSPRTIFARIDRPVNALQLCHWQFLYKETL